MPTNKQGRYQPDRDWGDITFEYKWATIFGDTPGTVALGSSLSLAACP